MSMQTVHVTQMLMKDTLNEARFCALIFAISNSWASFRSSRQCAKNSFLKPGRDLSYASKRLGGSIVLMEMFTWGEDCSLPPSTKISGLSAGRSSSSGTGCMLLADFICGDSSAFCDTHGAIDQCIRRTVDRPRGYIFKFLLVTHDVCEQSNPKSEKNIFQSVRHRNPRLRRV